MRAVALALVIAAGCGRGSGPSTSSGAAPTRVVDHAGAMAAVGSQVRIAGTAMDAKIAGLVDTGTLHVYCLDRSHWPDAQRDQPIVVEGLLEHTGEFESKTTSTGLVTQGTTGKVYVIRRCTLR